MSCCHTKKLIMRTRLASDSLSHSADSFSLSLNLCRAQPSRSACHSISVAISLSQSVCHSISVAISLSRSVYHSIFVVTSLSHSVCHDSHNQLITSQSANHKSISHKSVNHSNPLPHQFLLSSHTVSWPINHAPVYPISTCLSYLSYCTQSIIIDSLYNDPSVK